MHDSKKPVKILFAIFIMVFSFTVLTYKIPETKFVQKTIEHLEESQNTLMSFSGTTIATSLAISALPDDFASPLASTVSDLNTYFIFMFAVIFVEKLMVVEGIKIAFAYIIPAACILYVTALLSHKTIFKNFAVKLTILGISLIAVIPLSTHFTQTVCKDYMAYVEETIAEANVGASKINEVMASDTADATFFEKISDAFKTAIKDVSDLLTYFKNVVKKCVNSVAIMIVTTFVMPLLIMILFRWLLKELFALHFPLPAPRVRLPHKHPKDPDGIKLISSESTTEQTMKEEI